MTKKVKYIEHEIVTTSTVRDIASMFREGIQNPSGFIGRIGNVNMDWEFHAIESTDDPFAALDEPTEAPAFSVGASYGLKWTPGVAGGGLRRAMDQSVGGGVHLRIWDSGARRRVTIQHLGDLSPHSQRCVKAALDRLRVADPSMSMTESRGKLQL